LTDQSPEPVRSISVRSSTSSTAWIYVTWRRCVRGEVYRLRGPRDARGHEQAGSRYAVVVQSDHLPLSTWLVAPASTSARAATFRPEVNIAGRANRVLAEQTTAVDPQRLGDSVGQLSFDEQRRVDAALRVVLEL
jgi:mRNA interferase MazF